MTIVWLVLIVLSALVGYMVGARRGYNTALDSGRTIAGESELGPEWVSRKLANRDMLEQRDNRQ